MGNIAQALYIVACHFHHVPSADRHFSTVVFVGLRLAVVYDVVHAAIKHILWLLYIDYSGAPLNLTPLLTMGTLRGREADVVSSLQALEDECLHT